MCGELEEDISIVSKLSCSRNRCYLREMHTGISGDCSFVRFRTLERFYGRAL